ncbi:MAG: TolC family protein [Pseudomonadota bacterium]
MIIFIYILSNKKMNLLIKICIFCFCFTIILASESQDDLNKNEANQEPKQNKIELSLKDCLIKGLNNAPNIKASQLTTEYYREKLKEAQATSIFPVLNIRNYIGPVPQARGNALYSPDSGISWEDLTINLGFFERIELEALQPIYTFGKIGKIFDIAKEGIKASKYQEVGEKLNTVINIKKLFYAIQTAYEFEDLVKETYENYDRAYSKADEMYRSGKGKVSNLDMQKLKIFKLEVDKQQCRLVKELDIAISALKLLLDIAPEFEVKIIPEDFKDKTYILQPKNFFINTASENNFDLKSLASVVEIKKLLWEREKSNYYPDIFILGGFKFGIAPNREDQTNPFVRDDFNLIEGGFALGVSQALNFWKTNKKVRAAKIEYEKVIQQEKYAKMGINVLISQLYNQTDEAINKIEISKKSIKYSRTLLYQSVSAFESGFIDVSAKDLTDAYLIYSKAKTDFYTSLFAYDHSLAQLYKNSGMEEELMKSIK